MLISVHSHLALSKLAQLQIGEMVPFEDNRFSSSETLTMKDYFDPYEYRRYALVSKEPLAANGGYKLRFGLLYPHDSKRCPPILPGQCVEISTSLAGDNFTRFYSPTGSLYCFDIILKVVKGGRMSTYLATQRIADRQFRIRGPFGCPLVDPFRPLNPAFSDFLPRNVFFIAGGSGITPFLQILSFCLLPSKVKLMVYYYLI
jgi:NAD(P)H-flavin reductase